MTAAEARELATSVNDKKNGEPSGFARTLRANIDSLASAGKFRVEGSLSGDRGKDPVFQELREEGYIVKIEGHRYGISWGDCAGR